MIEEWMQGIEQGIAHKLWWKGQSFWVPILGETCVVIR